MSPRGISMLPDRTKRSPIHVGAEKYKNPPGWGPQYPCLSLRQRRLTRI